MADLKTNGTTLPWQEDMLDIHDYEQILDIETYA
jgi:hypothetical protein